MKNKAVKRQNKSSKKATGVISYGGNDIYPIAVGGAVSIADEREIEESVKKTVAEYGETLRMLGSE